jgi:hypothetical protein
MQGDLPDVVISHNRVDSIDRGDLLAMSPNRQRSSHTRCTVSELGTEQSVVYSPLNGGEYPDGSVSGSEQKSHEYKNHRRAEQQ